MTDYTKENVELTQTCGACPEQYDMFLNGKEIGYFRLRHGHFYAQYLPTEEIVFSADPKGDGMFEDDERDLYLKKAIKAIIDKHYQYTEELSDITYEVTYK